LFSVLLNDLEEFSNYVGNNGLDVDKNIETYLRLLILMYADNTVLISDYAAKLQSSLYNFVDFC